MLPRFSNPHFLPLQTQIVSREDIYSDSNQGAPHALEYDTEALEQLNSLLKTSLPQYIGLAPDSNGKNKKRRRVTIENANPASLKEPICMCESSFDRYQFLTWSVFLVFRLISTSLLPVPISLLPPPPPPSS